MIIGIDPGISGALAVLDDGVLDVYDFPSYNMGTSSKQRRRLDIRALIDEAFGCRIMDNTATAYIEKAQAMPIISKKQKNKAKGPGIASVFNYGMSYGMLLSMLTTLGIPYTEVHPRTWKKVMLADMDKQSKDASRMRASQLWPSYDYFGRKRDEHRAEAALIAKYGEMIERGE